MQKTKHAHWRVDIVKIARTYTIDVDVARDLKQKYNQSQFVEDAIKAKLYPSSVAMKLHDAELHTLLYQCMRLVDADSMEWKLLHNMWEIENKKHIISLGLDANL